jgi:sugar lactone lactonase YvrE
MQCQRGALRILRKTKKGEGMMRSGLTKLALAMLASTAFAAAAQAQASYPCTSDLPNPYRLVANWAQMPRSWSPINAITVDDGNNFWGVDRCEEAGCKAVFQITADGKTLKNFGADLFVEPHQVAVDHDGNVWVADASPKGAKGLQVTKLAPDGRVILKLGKPGVGQGSAALDSFDSPTGVAIASNGDVFIAQGHGEKQNNSRILKFTKDGKFIKSFGSWGAGNGELRSPHAIAIDSQDRLYVGDRSNSRVVVFDKDGKFLAAWKQFGRPSGIAIDKSDMLYVIDSQSDDKPGDRYNPGCKRGIRVGNAKDGKVLYYIPPPTPADPKWQPAIGVAADKNGNIYAASDDQHNVVKWVKQ